MPLWKLSHILRKVSFMWFLKTCAAKQKFPQVKTVRNFENISSLYCPGFLSSLVPKELRTASQVKEKTSCKWICIKCTKCDIKGKQMVCENTDKEMAFYSWEWHHFIKSCSLFFLFLFLLFSHFCFYFFSTWEIHFPIMPKTRMNLGDKL